MWKFVLLEYLFYIIVIISYENDFYFIKFGKLFDINIIM